MINLDIYTERFIEFKLDGKLIKVKEPSARLIKRITSLGKESDEVKVLEGQYGIVAEILSNNTSSEKFSRERVEGYPQSLINAIMEQITKLMSKIEKSPN